MSRVTCIQLDGYDLIFIPGDHTPEHFHLSKKGESWEVAVEFLFCTEKHLETRPVRPAFWKRNQHRLSGAILKQLREAIIANQAALLAEWEAAHKGL